MCVFGLFVSCGFVLFFSLSFVFSFLFGWEAEKERDIVGYEANCLWKLGICFLYHQTVDCLYFIYSRTRYSVTENPLTNLDLLHTERHNNTRQTPPLKSLYRKERSNTTRLSKVAFARPLIPEEAPEREGATRSREGATEGVEAVRSRTAEPSRSPTS